MNQTEILQGLKYMPRFLGKLKYPGGATVSHHFILLNGEQPHEIFYRGNILWSREEKLFLKEYIIYYVNAPIIDHLRPEGLIEKLSNLTDPKSMFNICITCGINPF